MTLNNMEYKESHAEYSDIVHHLRKCDKLFSPPLSSDVNIEEYSKKIFNHAVTFEAWKDRKLVGMVACYLNDQESKQGFITSVSVIDSFAARGIGKQLLINCEEYARKWGTKVLALEVNVHNHKAISLYSKAGFMMDGQEGEKGRMKKNLEERKPLVSICCVTYNHAKYIRKTLESFMMQRTTFPFEVLIHDDASTDGTQDIVREFEEKYFGVIKPIYQEINQHSKGVSISVTFNFPRAQGKYIALCEGDDFWTDPLKLQKQVDFLEANPEYVACYHNAVIVDEHDEIIQTSKLPDSCKRDYTCDDLSKGACILTLTICFRNVLRDFPDEFTHVYNGDTFLHSLMGRFGTGKYMTDISPSAYRRHSASVWSGLDTLDKILRSSITFSWMHRYYKRICNIKYANYFKNLAMDGFINVLQIIAYNPEPRNERIAKEIMSHYADILDGVLGHKIQELMRKYQYLIGSGSLDHLTVAKGEGFPEEQRIQFEEYTVSGGEKLFEAGDVEGAKACFLKVLEVNPQNVDALNNLGFLAFQEGRLDQAMAWFEWGLKLQPHNSEILENIGQIFVMQEAYSDAVPYFQKALSMQSDNVNLLNALANCLIHTGELMQAEEIYTRSYRLDTTQAYVREILGGLERIKTIGNV